MNLKIKKIIFLSFLLRLIIIFLTINILNYDLLSYLKIGKSIGDIYRELARFYHPYLPFFLYIERFFVWLGQLFHFNDLQILIFIKIFINLVDLINIYLVYLLTNKKIKSTLFYAFNPISLLVFSFHGQFDSLPILFLLLTFFFLKKKEKMSMIFYSISIMIKTWSIIFFFFIFKKLKNKKNILLILIFPLLSVFLYQAIFKSNLIDILKPIFLYQGVWAIWGISLFFESIRFRYQKLIMLVFILFIFSYSFLKKFFKDFNKEIVNFLLIFFILTPGFSVQYFSWLMPFLSLIDFPKKNFLVIIILIWMIGYYYQIIYHSNLVYFPIFSFICWLFFSIFSAKYILNNKY